MLVSSIAGLSLSVDQTNSVVYIILGIVGLLGASLPDSLPPAGMKKLNPVLSNEDSSEDSSKGLPFNGYNDK